jgi:hypothetical protein
MRQMGPSALGRKVSVIQTPDSLSDWGRVNDNRLIP